MLMASNDEDALFKIYHLTNDDTKDWRNLVKYGETLEIDIRRRVLWLWPTERDLREINKLFEQYNIMSVLSIGCGSGLFEWFLKEALDLKVYGVEVDRKWWHSNYAVKTFIPLNYIEDMKKESFGRFLQQCCATNSWDFALMFCYFNNRLAFLEYLKFYQGKHVIIVGPAGKTNIYTDPLPLEPHFPEDANEKWILKKSLPMESNNVFVLYEKY